MIDSDLVEVKTCQVCGSDRNRRLFEEPPYVVLRCTSCGLVFVTPRLAQDSLHEHTGYSDHREHQAQLLFAQPERLAKHGKRRLHEHEGEQVDLTQEQRDQLRALGYLDGPTSDELPSSPRASEPAA